jgi:hypothetical protein
MPDHLHMALRGAITASFQETALSFQNNLAYALGQTAIWQPGFYVGTFSEYDIRATGWRVASSRRALGGVVYRFGTITHKLLASRRAFLYSRALTGSLEKPGQ